MEKTEFEDFEVIYTFDMNYQGRDSYKESIIEPECDELVEDEDDFIFIVKFRSENNG